MNKIPDFSDTEAMAMRGKRSALYSLRNEVAETLRNVSTSVQAADIGELAEFAPQLEVIGERLKVISAMWNAL